MTAWNTSFFFSGSNNGDILFSTTNICAAFLHIHNMWIKLKFLSIIAHNIFFLELFGFFCFVKYKVIIFNSNSKTYVIAIFPFRTIKFRWNQFCMILKSLLRVFLTFSIVLSFHCKVLLKNKSFKKILKSSGPKMDPWLTPAIVSDHKL